MTLCDELLHHIATSPNHAITDAQFAEFAASSGSPAPEGYGPSGTPAALAALVGAWAERSNAGLRQLAAEAIQIGDPERIEQLVQAVAAGWLTSDPAERAAASAQWATYSAAQAQPATGSAI